MAKFRKKPVVIEAVQWTGQNFDEIKAFAWGQGTKGGRDIEFDGDELLIHTLESGRGPLVASEDDWIIKGVAGEFYPCKPHIFTATYEAVE